MHLLKASAGGYVRYDMIAIGSDHAGYDLKNEVIKYFEENGIEYKDCGTYSKESCDYPIYAEAVARAVQKGEAEQGVLVCGTGLGMSYAANKLKGIRAAALSDCVSARLAREHNNANIVCFGQNIVGKAVALEIIKIFLSTEFQGGRHERRVAMIDKIEA